MSPKSLDFRMVWSVVAWTPPESSEGPLAVNPVNPHYGIFHGNPTALLTSAEHFGAVVNKDYALSHHASMGGYGNMYTVTPRDYREDLTLDLSCGAYKIDWMDPATGEALHTETVNHMGGRLKVVTPEHTVDAALRIKRA